MRDIVALTCEQATGLINSISEAAALQPYQIAGQRGQLAQQAFSVLCNRCDT